MSEAENASRQRGNEFGHRWRTEVATMDQAARLIDLWSILTDAGSWDLYFTAGNGSTPGERLFSALSPPHHGGPLAAYVFWREIGDAADPADCDFVKGFAEGALGFNVEGKVHGGLLRKVVLAALELERPTVEDVVKATGICEDSAGRLLHAAQTFGLVRYEQP